MAPKTQIRRDPQEIARAIATLFEPGQCVELRIPKTEHEGTVSGYFSDHDALAKTVASRNGDAGVYLTLNPVKPALLARCANRVRSRARVTTSDKDVERRRWLLVDCDPERPAEISSSDAEHDAALERARDVCRILTEESDWPAPILADSGNGAHLLYGIDLENNEASTRLVEGVLKALSKRFSDAVVKIDEAVFNAARICKAYGTAVRKGDNTPERPHRISRILESPRSVVPVKAEQLSELSMSVESTKGTPARRSASIPFSVEKWIGDVHLPVRPAVAHEKGRKWVLQECPFNPEHKAPDAAIFETANGRPGFRCLHNSCANNHWRELRDLIEGPRPRHAPEAAVCHELTEWPDPLPLTNPLPPVERFDLGLLPSAFRPLVEDVTERMQVVPDFVAIPTVVAYAAAAGRRIAMQPKAVDTTWRVVPNLWGAIVAPPGYMKTPAIMAATKPLQELERDHATKYREDRETYDVGHEQFEIRVNAWKQKATQDAKAGRAVCARPYDAPVEPIRTRFITNDATAEALHQILSANPAGVLNMRDELSGWLAQLDKPGREGDRAFWLEAWTGTGSYTMDRIGRGTTHTDACCVSVLGGIQPGRLRRYLSQALTDGPGNDGLIQRFQLLAWPDLNTDWKYCDRMPKQNALQAVTEIFRSVVLLDPADPRIYRFDSDAQCLFIEWQSELETELRSGTLHPALISHLAKYRSLMPSLAMLFEIADNPVTAVVALEHARQAAMWCTYLRSHAERLYSCIVSADLRAAEELAPRIKSRKLGTGSFSLRDVYLKQWSGLDSPETARAALMVLGDANWVQPEQNPSGAKGGRPSEIFSINPKVFDDH